MKKNTLVMSGGGIKGFSLIGVLKALEEKGELDIRLWYSPVTMDIGTENIVLIWNEDLHTKKASVFRCWSGIRQLLKPERNRNKWY